MSLVPAHILCEVFGFLELNFDQNDDHTFEGDQQPDATVADDGAPWRYPLVCRRWNAAFWSQQFWASQTLVPRRHYQGRIRRLKNLNLPFDTQSPQTAESSPQVEPPKRSGPLATLSVERLWHSSCCGVQQGGERAQGDRRGPDNDYNVDDDFDCFDDDDDDEVDGHSDVCGGISSMIVDGLAAAFGSMIRKP
eukprot:Selendium_serpulae@DN5875_c0_g1_i3.p1